MFLRRSDLPCYFPHPLRGAKALLIITTLVSGCAEQNTSLTPDFTVDANHLSVPVHVSGAALGTNTADLKGMIKQAAECGLKRSDPATGSALEGRNMSMQWSVNGLLRPGLSSVTLRLHADGLADQVDVERMSLQASPTAIDVREMCEMTADAMRAMHEKLAVRSARQ
jgi:hypothetical protein